MAGINKKVANLKFIKGADQTFQGLASYLQAYFGQTAGVIRKTGTALVASGTTSLAVADTGIAATDIISMDPVTQGGTAHTQVESVVINAGVGFTLSTNQDPGAGGALFHFIVVRPVP